MPDIQHHYRSGGRPLKAGYALIAAVLLAVVFSTSAYAIGPSEIIVRLQDSDGALLTGGSLKYHDGSWKNASDNGDGTFTVNTNASSVTYQMTYNNGKQTKSNVSTSVNPVIFETISTTVRLEKKNGGDGLQNGIVRFHQVTWKNYGSPNITDVDGEVTQELLPGNYTFQMTYNNGVKKHSNHAVNTAGAHTVYFRTTSTIVKLARKADGGVLSGGTVRFHQVTWKDYGSPNVTDITGKVVQELLDGKYTFQMTYNNGVKKLSNYEVPCAASHTVLFETTTCKVKLARKSDGGVLAGGAVRFHQVSWKNFGSPNITDANGIVTAELLEGKYTFQMTYNNGVKKLSNYEVPCAAEHTVLFETTTTMVKLARKATGTGLSGGAVRFHQVSWKNFGSPNITDANGIVTAELLEGKYTFQMTYNNGVKKYSAYSVPCALSHTVLFETTTTKIKLGKCGGSGLAGGTVRFHQVSWKNFGSPNVTDANGEIESELLDGNYTFKLTYNNGTQTLSSYAVPCALSHTIPFQATQVCLQYSGVIKYHQVSWKTFTNTDCLLPGTYTFSFDGHRKVLDISGCSVDKSIVVYKLSDGNGQPQAGAKGQINAGGWKTAEGETDSQGILLACFNGKLTGNRQLRMQFDGSTSAKKRQNIAGNSIVEFQLVNARVQAWDGAMTLPNAEGGNLGKVYINRGGWKYLGQIDNGELMVKMFPGNYKFKMTNLNFSSREKYYNLNHSPLVQFPVVRMAVQVKDQHGNHLGAGDPDAQVYVNYGGWKSLGKDSDDGTLDGIINKALLAGNRKIKMVLSYSSYQKYFNLAIGQPPACFPAVRNPVKVETQHGADIGSVLTDPDAKAYVNYGGWKYIGQDSKDGSHDGVVGYNDGNGVNNVLLAGNRKFKMVLGHSSYQKYYNIKHTTPGNADVACFPAVRNPVQVKDQCGSLLGPGDPDAQAWVNYGGWKYLGNDGDGNGIVECVVLAGNRKFKMVLNNSSYQKYFNVKQTGPGSIDPACFPAVRNPVLVRDQDGALLPDAEGQGKCYVNYGGWKYLGMTNGGVLNTVLLAGNRKFKMVLNHSSYQKYWNIKHTGACSAALAEFPALRNAVKLLNGCDNGVAGGKAYVNYGGWKLLGTTGPDGCIPGMSLLAGNRKFKMVLPDGSSKQKYVNIQWGPPPVLAVFGAAELNLQFSGDIEIKRGSKWKTFSSPMLLFNDTYAFRFDDALVKHIDVNQCPTDITIVVFKLRKSGVTPVAGGTGRIHAGSWKHSPGTTDADGCLVACFDGILSGNRMLRMEYNGSVSATKWQNVSANSYVDFNLTDVTVRAWDGAASLPNDEGGDQGKVYIHRGGSYQYLGQINNGEFRFCMFAGNNLFKMTDLNFSARSGWYNVNGNSYNLDFPVVRKAVQVKDQHDNYLGAGDPDAKAWIHYGGSYKLLGSDSDDGALDGIIDQAVLAGNILYKMELGPSSYRGWWNSTPALFPAVRSPVEVRDQCGNLLGAGDPDASAWVHYGGSYKALGKDSDDGSLDGVVSGILLAGNRLFKMELGPSSYSGWWNIKQTPVLASFPAVRNPIEVRDQNGVLLPDTEGIGKAWVHYGGSFKALPNSSGGIVHTVLLAGNRLFKMELNHSSMQQWKNIKHTGLCSAEKQEFPALKDVVRLHDNLGNPLDGGQAWVHYGGSFKPLGSTNSAGFIPNMSLLSGNRLFKMTYSSETKQKWIHIRHTPLTLADFVWDGTNLNKTGAWADNAGQTELNGVSLHQNYPNPVRNETTIGFSLPAKTMVHLAIYDALGRHVKTLVQGMLEQGQHEVTWNLETDSGSLPAADGMFIYRLSVGNTVIEKQMMLIR